MRMLMKRLKMLLDRALTSWAQRLAVSRLTAKEGCQLDASKSVVSPLAVISDLGLEEYEILREAAANGTFARRPMIKPTSRGFYEAEFEIESDWDKALRLLRLR